MNIFKLPVHPVADLFPMLDADRLAELASDIAENGLRQPLVIGEHDGETVLIDGRNRRAACELAKVEPTTIALNGEDQTAYICSTNLMRRDLSASQRTMLAAKIYPETTAKGGRGKKSVLGTQFNSSHLAKARLVLRVLPEMAEQVIAGTAMLNAAYDKAVQEQDVYNSGAKQMERLKAAAPDLYELVAGSKMNLNEAAAALRERERVELERKKQKRLSVFQALRDGLSALQTFASSDYGDLREFFSIKDRADFDRFFPEPSALKTAQKSIVPGIAKINALIKKLGDDYEL